MLPIQQENQNDQENNISNSYPVSQEGIYEWRLQKTKEINILYLASAL